MKIYRYISIFAQDPFTGKTLTGVQWPYRRDDLVNGNYREDFKKVKELALKYKWKRDHPLKMRLKLTDIHADFV